MGRHYAQCRTPIHTFEQSNVILERYCRKIILDQVHLFRGAIRSDFLFMDDNARPHRNAEAPNTLESGDINCKQWFGHFLELNSLKHVCDPLYRRI